MDNRELPWADHEKVYLLAEMIKAAQVPSHVLFNFVRESQIQPRWNDMALPPGRSLRSSQVAYETLSGNYSQYQRPPVPAAGAHPIMYTGPEASKKRPFQDIAAPMGRLIQPRPSPAYPGDYIQAGPAYGSAMSTPTGEPANKKKRGRPTKAEAQQRAQEAAARGEVYPPPRRARVSITAPPEPSPLGPESRPHEQRTPPQSAPGPMSAAMTPQNQMQTEEGAESSSGKRRRMRPQPLELDMPPRPVEMESPLAYGGSGGDPHRNPPYASYTPISAPLPSSAESRDRDTRMEGVEETTQPRTTTPHSFKDTVGI